MKFAKKISFVTLMVIAASFGAAAQERSIKFKLTRPAHIGNAALAAGSYRMDVYSDSQLLAIVSPEDRNGHSVIALPKSYGTTVACKASSVTLRPSGDDWNLTSVCMGESEDALYFPIFKSKKSTVAAQTTDTAALAGAQ